jgi:hypothetical protein
LNQTWVIQTAPGDHTPNLPARISDHATEGRLEVSPDKPVEGASVVLSRGMSWSFI